MLSHLKVTEPIDDIEDLLYIIMKNRNQYENPTLREWFNGLSYIH